MEGINNIRETAEAPSKEELVARNFQKMHSDMLSLLRHESIGGNAGQAEIDGKIYTCAGANAWVNPENGEIKMFGNIQDVPEDVVSSNANICFRVAVNFREAGRKGFFRIIDVLDKEHLEPFAQEVIDASVADYNAIEIVKSKKVG